MPDDSRTWGEFAGMIATPNRWFRSLLLIAGIVSGTTNLPAATEIPAGGTSIIAQNPINNHGFWGYDPRTSVTDLLRTSVTLFIGT
ncbi:MAG: hypothetical protein O3C43_17980, partial [Verrucomicrobia bacterium]|nr:hypothetical protein [Verrucomicrobiota bacterium]